MVSLLKKIIEKLFPRLVLEHRASNLVIRDPKSYLHSTGWIESVKQKKPLDGNGEIIPWMNYAIVEFLKGRLNNSMTLFEYGSGYSTRFYAKHVKKVVSVEDDNIWFEKISAELPDNAEVLFVESDIDGKYCRSVKLSNTKYDIIVVDGRDRANCVANALDCVSDRGVILLDDSDRERYEWAIELAKKSGYRTLEFGSLKPDSSNLEVTTLIYRDGNCLGV